VGDSRAYWLVDGELQRLTKDHSLVQRLLDEGKLTAEEAENFQYRNILLRALGQEDALSVDVDVRELPQNGKLLLCSDGLCGEVSDAKIQAIMNQGFPPDQIADELISAALEAGGGDNISVIVADFMT
jgi:protein phosphatase